MSKKSPPKCKDGTSYTSWKNEIEMWVLVTSILKKEQAIVVLLEALDENIKEEKAVSELTASDQNVDTVLKLMLDKLDLTFEAEKVDDAYSTYSNFNVSVKKEGLSVNDYILEFEHLYCKMAEHDMKLPDTILAFKLLDGAGLNEAPRQLALTLGNDLTFSSMKTALKRIFSRSVDQAETSDVKIKEDAFFVKRRNNFSRQRNKGGAVPRQKWSNFKMCCV